MNFCMASGGEVGVVLIRHLRRGVFLALVLLIFPLFQAYGASRTIYLERSVPLDFEPKEAVFFVDSGDEKVIKAEGALFAPIPVKVSQAQGVGTWYVGTEMEIPLQLKELTVSLLVIGAGDRRVFLPPRKQRIDEQDLFRGSVDALRDEIRQQQDSLRSFRVQSRAQENTLERLRGEAELAGNLSRVVEVREEIERVSSTTKDLEKDVENLQKFIGLVKLLPPPKNFSRRERELIKQSKILADIAQTSEVKARDRRHRSGVEVQQMVAAIEAARTVDQEALSRKLLTLRKQRREMERGLSSSSPAVVETDIR